MFVVPRRVRIIPESYPGVKRKLESLVIILRALSGSVDSENAVHAEGAQRTRRVVEVEDVRQAIAHRIVLPDLRQLVGGAEGLQDRRVARSEALDAGAIGLAESDDDPARVEEREKFLAPVSVAEAVSEREGDVVGSGAEHACMVSWKAADVKPLPQYSHRNISANIPGKRLDISSRV